MSTEFEPDLHLKSGLLVRVNTIHHENTKHDPLSGIDMPHDTAVVDINLSRVTNLRIEDRELEQLMAFLDNDEHPYHYQWHRVPHSGGKRVQLYVWRGKTPDEAQSVANVIGKFFRRLPQAPEQEIVDINHDTNNVAAAEVKGWGGEKQASPEVEEVDTILEGFLREPDKIERARLIRDYIVASCKKMELPFADEEKGPLFAEVLEKMDTIETEIRSQRLKGEMAEAHRLNEILRFYLDSTSGRAAAERPEGARKKSRESRELRR